MFKNKSILVTGGTGSFGKKFVEIVSKKYSNQIKKLIIFKKQQHEMLKLLILINILLYDFYRRVRMGRLYKYLKILIM